MWVSTFHSACVRILRREHGHLGLPSSFTIYDADDSRRLVTAVARDHELDVKRQSAARPAGTDLRAQERADRPRDRAGQGGHRAGATDRRDLRRLPAGLIAARALDFDDLIMTTVNLFQAFPPSPSLYRRRFRHVLVDEVPGQPTTRSTSGA